SAECSRSASCRGEGALRPEEATPPFRRVLGSSFEGLPPALRELHGSKVARCWVGRAGPLQENRDSPSFRRALGKEGLSLFFGEDQRLATLGPSPGTHAVMSTSSLTFHGTPLRVRNSRSISSRVNGREPRRPNTAIWPPVSSTARSRSRP